MIKITRRVYFDARVSGSLCLYTYYEYEPLHRVGNTHIPQPPGPLYLEDAFIGSSATLRPDVETMFPLVGFRHRVYQILHIGLNQSILWVYIVSCFFSFFFLDKKLEGWVIFYTYLYKDPLGDGGGRLLNKMLHVASFGYRPNHKKKYPYILSFLH